MPPFGNKKPIGPAKINDKALKNVVFSESDAIMAATKAYVEADVHVQPAKLAYAITKQTDTFARVSVSVAGEGGYYAMLKKVYSIWIVIVTGQDLPGKDIGEKYGLPGGWFSTEY